MTATEVSRNFASVLDSAEHGETIVITRGGRRLAALSPTSTGNGAAIKNFLAAHAVDEDFANDVTSARTLLTTDDKAAFDDLPGVHSAHQ